MMVFSLVAPDGHQVLADSPLNLHLTPLSPPSLCCPPPQVHMRAMFTAIDADENGIVDWFEMVSFICDAIEHIEREAYIQSASVPAS